MLGTYHQVSQRLKRHIINLDRIHEVTHKQSPTTISIACRAGHDPYSLIGQCRLAEKSIDLNCNATTKAGHGASHSTD